MPNIQSAVKRMHQAARARIRNRAEKSELLSLQRKLYEMPKDVDKDARMKAFRAYCSALDKAAKKGMIKKNNADRHKSRASARLVAR